MSQGDVQPPNNSGNASENTIVRPINDIQINEIRSILKNIYKHNDHILADIYNVSFTDPKRLTLTPELSEHVSMLACVIVRCIK